MTVAAPPGAPTDAFGPKTQLQLVLQRPPTTKDELWWVVKVLWGVELPRVQVCPDHTAPFDAFAEAYFGNRARWVLWYGSRGTGKSYMLALLAMTKAALLEINVTLLGGSMAQSNNIHEHVESLLSYKNAPSRSIKKQIKTELEFSSENWIRPLPASQKTVRGPHPHMTLLDEIDEMEKPIYDAAMGQAMEKPNARGVKVGEMVVASSTWQNPIGTFQQVKEDADERGLPVRTWCWREVIEPHGWMSADFIERKRLTVPAEMFRVEYDLGEPSSGSRAFDLEALNRAFVEMPPVASRKDDVDEEYVFEQPDARGSYAAGADWAKERDKTVIAVARTDVTPHRVVYLRRVNRKPWPMMIAMFDTAVELYNAVSAHDGTGLGNVVHDLVEDNTNKVLMIGQKRVQLINEYIVAVEQGLYRLPRNTPMYTQHKATTVDDVYATTASAHLPDDVVAMAMVHRAFTRRGSGGAGVAGVAKDERYAKAYSHLQTAPTLEQGSMGEVTVADHEHLGYDSLEEEGSDAVMVFSVGDYVD